MGRRGRRRPARAVRRRRPGGRRRGRRRRRRGARSRRRRCRGRPLGRRDGRRGTTSPPRSPSSAGPNVGKSSLLNALLGEDRAIVSRGARARPATPSTRRSAWGRSEVVLIDTAGHPAPRQGRRRPGRRALLDAARAPGAVARRRRRPRHRRRRGPDRRRTPTSPATSSRRARASSSRSTSGTSSRTRPTRRSTSTSSGSATTSPFLDFAPIVSISAKTGQRVGRVLEAGDRHLGRAPQARSRPAS